MAQPPLAARRPGRKPPHKSAQSAVSRYAGQLGLRTRYRLALTGTPMPHSPLDIWAQYRFLDRTIYDLTFTSCKQRYAIFNESLPKPVAWRHLDDLRARFDTIASRSPTKCSTCQARRPDLHHRFGK